MAKLTDFSVQSSAFHLYTIHLAFALFSIWAWKCQSVIVLLLFSAIWQLRGGAFATTWLQKFFPTSSVWVGFHRKILHQHTIWKLLKRWEKEGWGYLGELPCYLLAELSLSQYPPEIFAPVLIGSMFFFIGWHFREELPIISVKAENKKGGESHCFKTGMPVLPK